ncbi:Rap1a/Tai family immunity protein [Variovorax sp. KK3]|uniref:Rap1a/Tai family immunity protein n=1 Tax=Variovorax sp. KK3 TaxID=1855728 RepID=UPI00211967FC|nr:Rap1a/Tai family immunity protein [Variovorax sp. KK3]
MSIRELRLLESNEKDGKLYANYYLVGVVEGLREASEAEQRAGQKPLFCVNGRRLEPSMARTLYQTELTRNADSYEADMPVQLVVSAALRNSYRCN